MPQPSMGLRRELIPNHPVGYSVEGLASTRNSLPLTQACLRSGPFAPRSLPASSLLCASPTPGQGRSRSYGFLWVVEVFFPTLPGLPGSSTVLSLRAVPNHPGRSDKLSSLLPCRCQASSSSADWPPPLASRGRIRFACATAHRFASPVSTRWITPSRSGSATCSNE